MSESFAPRRRGTAPATSCAALRLPAPGRLTLRDLLSETDSTVPRVRLIVARCEVRYTGRLTAVLPESTRLLIFKSDGSVLVHADAGGYKPLKSA